MESPAEKARKRQKGNRINDVRKERGRSKGRARSVQLSLHALNAANAMNGKKVCWNKGLEKGRQPPERQEVERS